MIEDIRAGAPTGGAYFARAFSPSATAGAFAWGSLGDHFGRPDLIGLLSQRAAIQDTARHDCMLALLGPRMKAALHWPCDPCSLPFLRASVYWLVG
jgi:hypothetical protein